MKSTTFNYLFSVCDVSLESSIAHRQNRDVDLRFSGLYMAKICAIAISQTSTYETMYASGISASFPDGINSDSLNSFKEGGESIDGPVNYKGIESCDTKLGFSFCINSFISPVYEKT